MDTNDRAEFEQLIDNIRAQLTGDRRVDGPYLIQQSEMYRDHPLGPELSAEIGRLMYEMVPDEMRAEFSAIQQEQRKRYDQMLIEASTAMKTGDLARAEMLLRNLAEQAVETPSDRDSVYYDFQDELERMFVLARGEERRNVMEAPLPCLSVFELLCMILLQDNRPEEALEAATSAIALNYVAVMPRLEKTYCLQRLGRWQELKDVLGDAFALCWTPLHFSQWYRALAPWFFHSGDFEGFAACLMLSLACVEDEECRKLLDIAEQLTGTPFDDEFAESVPLIANDRGIPLRPDPLWYELSMTLAKHYIRKEEFKEGLRYLKVAYDLNRSPELAEQIERLTEHVGTPEPSK